MRQRIISLLLLLTLALSASADNLGYSKEKPLLFGIDMDYAPMEYIDGRGIPRGFDVEFTRRLMERMDIPFTFAPNTWANIAGDVLHGKVDLGMMVYSPYRKDQTNYSRAVFRLYYQIVYPKKSEGRFGLRDVEGKKIALMKSRPIIDTLTKVGAKAMVVEDLKGAFLDLQKGKYDALICFRYQASYFIGELELDDLSSADLALTPREYCYVSHDKKLIDAINTELDKMEAEGEIDDVYGNISSVFGKTVIPRWVWWLLASVIIVGLVLVLVQERRAKKMIMKEMDRAKKSEELKDIFLSNLSHSLRTPLNAIIGFSDLLMSSPTEIMPEDEQKELLGLINSN
jgi:ABC-type amino acid transport substrate-binding protein